MTNIPSKKCKIQCVDIPSGFYYVKSGWSNNVEIRYLGNSFFEGNIEVVTPVPSHSEYQALKDNCELTHTRLNGTHQKIAQLEKKLDICLKALKWYDGLENLLIGWEMFTGQPKGTAKKALEKIRM